MGMDATATIRATAGTPLDRYGRSSQIVSIDGGDCPPSVIRGAKSTDTPGVYFTLDWFRAVTDAALLPFVRSLLNAMYPGGAEGVKGRHFFEGGEKYPGGATLMWGHASGIIMVEWNGSALDLLSEDARAQIVRDLCGFGCLPLALQRFGIEIPSRARAERLRAGRPKSEGTAAKDIAPLLARGFRCTRLDLAIDFIGQRLNIVDAAYESCQAGELCGARRFNPVITRTLEQFFGKTLYLGLRGENGSGQLVRVYDKGLETGTMKMGEWERYEVEFTSDRAAAAACQLTDNETNDAGSWVQLGKRLVLGAVEFRQVTNRRELKLRPLVEWWRKVLASVSGIRVRVPRLRADLVRFASWTHRCVWPSLLKMAELSDRPLEQLCALLAGPDVEPREMEPGSVLEQFKSWLAEQVSAVPAPA